MPCNNLYHTRKLKSIILLLLLANTTFNSLSQASWSTRMAFTLRDENNESIDLREFEKCFLLINVFGDTVRSEDLNQYLKFDSINKYFILNITTIGPRFSFALVHNQELMVIYLPFFPSSHIYAVDIKFRKGQYLFDFDVSDKETKYIDGNIPYSVIDKINWRKQSRRLKNSSYSGDQTYDSYLDEKH